MAQEVNTAQASQQPSPEGGQHSALSGVHETLFIPLYGKYLDFYKPRSILADRWAVDIINRLGGIEVVTEHLHVTPTHLSQVAVRTSLLDLWTAEFLDKHPNSTVLHLACGLDTRALRLQHKCGPGVRWIDLDVPEVVAVRRRIVPEPEIPGGYSLVGADVLKKAWLLDIPADRPTAVVMEGLTMYLQPDEGKELLRRLVERFPSGELIFDVASSFGTHFLNWALQWKSGDEVKFIWGVDYPGELEGLGDGLRLRSVVLNCDAPAIAKLPFSQWLRNRIIFWIPYLRTMLYFLRYEF